MSKFTTAFRELGTYKELLRSQVLYYCHTELKFDLQFYCLCSAQQEWNEQLRKVTLLFLVGKFELEIPGLPL